MFSARTQAILEADHKDFLATKMWLGMSRYTDGYNEVSAIMDQEIIVNYNNLNTDYISMQQMISPPLPPIHGDRQRQMRVYHNPSLNPSTRGRRSGTKNHFNGGKGKCIKEGEYKQSVNPSKRHRDRLNTELDNLAKLLPFSEDVIARLDKLSILRLSVSYLRNKNFFKGLAKSKSNEVIDEANTTSFKKKYSSLFSEAINGFLLVITLDGEVFYVSEKVKEYLGYSQSQVLHQPIETLVHDDDREELTSQLKGNLLPKIEEITDEDMEEKSDAGSKFVGQPCEFIIRLKSVLNTSSSDMYKPFKLSGTIRQLHIEPAADNLRYALFSFASPVQTSYSMLEIRMKSMLFCSKNRIDLSFLDLDQRGKEFFGYSKKDIFGRSSYVLVHRADIQHIRCKHTEIMTCGKTSLGTFRLMNKNNEWNWVCGYGHVQFKNGKPDYLVTTNRIMSKEEGLAMLKLRDEADREALKVLGLIEPDDPAKAIELGFPTASSNSMQSFNSAVVDLSPIPMPLASFIDSSVMSSMCMKQTANKDEHTSTPSVQQETADLLKDALFDIDAPERFLNFSANQIMNDPLSNLSPEDFHDNRQSPRSSISSGQQSQISIHSHQSTPQAQRISSNIGSFLKQVSPNVHVLSPVSPHLLQQPQQQQHSSSLKSVFTELTPVCGSSSSSICVSPQNHQNNINSNAFAFSNFDFSQQQTPMETRPSMKYVQTPFQNELYPDFYQRIQQQHQQQQQVNISGHMNNYMHPSTFLPSSRNMIQLNGQNLVEGNNVLDDMCQQMDLLNRKNTIYNAQKPFESSNFDHGNSSPILPIWTRPSQQQQQQSNFYPYVNMNNNFPVSSAPTQQYLPGTDYNWQSV